MSRTVPRAGLRLASLLLLALFACAPEEPSGSVQVLGSIPQALATGGITEVRVTASAADMASQTVSLTVADGVWSGTLQLPAGSGRTFSAEALDASGVRRYAGQVSGVTILSGQTTVVSITLQPLNPPPPFQNAAPSITAVTVTPAAVAPGGSISLHATVQDPNPSDTLTSTWTASAGTFSSPNSLSTTWTAPASPGPVHLTFTATDPQGASATFGFTVSVSAEGGTQVEVRINTWPQVSRITASPSTVDVGQTTTVVATASDTDGDALGYQWSASCAGTWADATTSTARFSPSARPSAGTCAPCALTVTVTDGRGGQTTGTLSLCVGPPPAVQHPPVILEGWRSVDAVGPGGLVTVGVRASDPHGGALTFSWAANVGTVSAPASTSTTSEVAWRAPDCVPEGTTPTLTATITSTLGLSTVRTFTVGMMACAPAAVCGDGISGPGEACDDGNTVTETQCPYGVSFCTACNSTCSAVLSLVGASCGDGQRSASEACDDGNTVTETECPYGTASCTFCDASCTSTLLLTGPYCGDGLRSASEACDDGNTLACGTCSATCQQAQFAPATGRITPVAGSSLVDGETFTLNDGFNPSRVYEFDKNGSVAGGRVPVSIGSTFTLAQVASAIASAINSQADVAVGIMASSASGSTVELTHLRPGTRGNQPLFESVTNADFRVSGMAGGAGSDCASGTGCTRTEDCAFGLECGPAGVCRLP